MPLPLPRLRTAVLVTGVALLAKRAMRRRIQDSPLWPLPALENPVSGHSERRSTTTRRLLVTERTVPAEGVVQLRLEGPGLPAWQPGAHLDLLLPSGLVRQYSLCGDPADPGTYTIATRLVADGRGGSREVHAQLHEGAEVEVRAPRNRFPSPGPPRTSSSRAASASRRSCRWCGPSRPRVPTGGCCTADARGPRCRSWTRSRSWVRRATG